MENDLNRLRLGSHFPAHDGTLREEEKRDRLVRPLAHRLEVRLSLRDDQINRRQAATTEIFLGGTILIA